MSPLLAYTDGLCVNMECHSGKATQIPLQKLEASRGAEKGKLRLCLADQGIQGRAAAGRRTQDEGARQGPESVAAH